MSFSSELKKELAQVETKADHCRNALIAGLTAPYDEEGYLRANLSRKCCKRAFLRGLFLAQGTMSDPEKTYQLEIDCVNEGFAAFTADLLSDLDIHAKRIERRGHSVVYLKEGDEIVRFLALLQANRSVLDLENIRVVKDVRNVVNRRVNCETANLQKSVSASVSQIEDIRFIEEHIGLEHLPASLREIAIIRLQNPDATIEELGTFLDPPVGKSGVNHRLRRLREIAKEEST